MYMYMYVVTFQVPDLDKSRIVFFVEVGGLRVSSAVDKAANRQPRTACFPGRTDTAAR